MDNRQEITTVAGGEKAKTSIKAKAIIAVVAFVVIAVLALIVILVTNSAERPLTAAELLDLGEKYLLELNYEQALVQFLEVIEVEPRNPRGYTGAAEAYLGLGDTDSAEAVLRKGLQALPNNAEIIDMARKLGVDVVVEFGGYDWLVLDIENGKALILTERVIEEKAYHNVFVSVTWDTSDMRTYLNGEFYNSFPEADRERIAQVTNTNPDNPWDFTEYGGYNRSPGGAETQDYVFLLNLDEVVKYFGGSEQLENQNHANNEWWGFHNLYSSTRAAKDRNGTDLGWWLRSPGYSPTDAAHVSAGGAVSFGGYRVDVGDGRVNDLGGGGGVRPALWLILES